MDSARLDPRADDYFVGLPDWQQGLCRQLRELVLGLDTEMIETIKRTVLPYYVLQGNVCALMGTRDHVNLFLYDPLAPDPHGIITRGQENKTGRQIKFFEGDRIPVEPLTDLLRAIVANNRAGGWRKLSPR